MKENKRRDYTNSTNYNDYSNANISSSNSKSCK